MADEGLTHNQQVEKDYAKSDKDFQQLIVPLIKAKMPHVKSVRSTDWAIPAEEKMDKELCIDYIVTSEKKISTLGSKLQWVNRQAYNSFTLRFSRASGKATEYGKIQKAIEDDGTYPDFLIHSYVNKSTSDVLGCVVVRTRDLFQHIKDHPEDVRYRANVDGSSTFLFVYWDDLHKAKVPMMFLEGGPQ